MRTPDKTEGRGPRTQTRGRRQEEPPDARRGRRMDRKAPAMRHAPCPASDASGITHDARRKAICRAMTDAHGGCPFACGSRAAGDESRPAPHCCANCMYANLMQDGDRELPICANTPAARGRIVRIDPAGVCPRFRAAPGPVLRCKPPRPRKGVRHIPLTKNRFAIVDERDYEELSRFKWCVSCTGRRKLYACRMEGRRLVRMHRQIMNAPAGKVVDHIDGNSLNNSRSNLRICTYSQNLCNRGKFAGATPYKGVFHRKDRDKYYAKIKFEGKEHYLGLYDDPAEAARAYDRKARELHGPFVRLNFPDETEQGNADV